MDVLAVLELPGWVGYGIAGAAMAGALAYMVRWFGRDARLAAQYQRPPTTLEIAVTVRGPDGVPLTHAELLRFAECWHWALECLARWGPWSRPMLRERLGAGNRVQVMATATWPAVGGGMAGGELVAGVIRVGPDLSALAHELAHRAEHVIEHGVTDNAHATWRARGISAADENYRAWLAKRSDGAVRSPPR